MIVVDSSVWIAHFRNVDSAPVQKLRTLESVGDILLGDLILLEILQGARDERAADRLESALRQFPVAAMLSGDLAPIAARHCRTLRGKGITVRKTIDLVIATFCIEHGHDLLHDDRGFVPFAQHLSLRTL